jgi:hypothetical protein
MCFHLVRCLLLCSSQIIFRFRLIFPISVNEVNHELALVFLTCITPLEEPLNLNPIPKTKKKKCDHEIVRHFQNKWSMQLPWVESVIVTICNVHQIQCVICSKMEGKPKLLVPKLDNLLRHVGHLQAKVASLRVEVGFLFFQAWL